MYKVILCHRRRESVAQRKLRTHWRDSRSRLVADLRAELGYSRYAQVHQLSRRNLLYLGIRATRSWLVTTFLSLFRGRKPRRLPRDRHTQREERWDVIDEFWYPSRQALITALTSRGGVDGLRRLIDDHAPLVRRTAVITAEEFVAAEDPGQRSSRIIALFCLRSLPGMTRGMMLHHWGTSHRELVLSLKRALKYRAYHQMHVRSDAGLQDVVDNLGGSAGQEFDGVAALAYRSQWGLILGFVDPRTQIANLKLVRDEITFIDGQRSALVFGRQFLFGP